MRANYPDLKSMRAMIAAQKNRTAMNSGWMNPMFSVGAMNVPYPKLKLDADPMTMIQFGLMQRIPFPGKTGLQRKLGDAKADAIVAELEVETREMEAMVRMAYYDLAATKSMVGLLDSGVTLLRLMKDAALAMNSSGMGSAADIYNVEAETADWQRKCDENEALIAKRRAELRQLIGNSETDSLAVSSLPLQLPSESSDAAISSGDRDNTPKLVAARQQLKVSQSSLQLAQHNWYPDLDLMFIYGYRLPLKMTTTSVDHNGVKSSMDETIYQDPMLSLGVTFPIPLFANSNQKAMIGEERAMLESNRQKLATAEREFEKMVRSEQAEIERLRMSIHRYQTEIIPAREQAWTASLAGYRSGRVPLMAVSEAMMKLIMAKMEERMSMAECWARTGNLQGRIEP